MNIPEFVIQNAYIINENQIFQGSVFIKDGYISDIQKGYFDSPFKSSIRTIDAKGKYLLPGVIDDQVHFRTPGLTHKADIYTESKAAVAGGITSFMEMPNTIPQTTTQTLLKEKFEIAAKDSLANYSFYMGATNDNINELEKTDSKKVCGIKVFMGSSTGNMLVDSKESLNKIFAINTLPIAVHCEDETTIQKNIADFRNKYGEKVPINMHPIIRSEEACYRSSSLAVDLASKHNTRLHILHLSTAKELSLLDNTTPLIKKRITAEVCVHHLWFSDKDYDNEGFRIKWNPAIKKESDRIALIEALNSNKIDIVATDHAPHTLEEKDNSYFKAPAGGPLVQHSLTAMLELYKKGYFSLETIVNKMCHSPAELFNIDKRGYIRKDYWADLVLVDPDNKWKVEKGNILYKCKWSPFEKHEFNSKITHTFINGNLVYNNGCFNEDIKGQSLLFNR